jgi:hypothetical protein
MAQPAVFSSRRSVWSLGPRAPCRSWSGPPRRGACARGGRGRAGAAGPDHPLDGALLSLARDRVQSEENGEVVAVAGGLEDEGRLLGCDPPARARSRAPDRAVSPAHPTWGASADGAERAEVVLQGAGVRDESEATKRAITSSVSSSSRRRPNADSRCTRIVTRTP